MLLECQAQGIAYAVEIAIAGSNAGWKLVAAGCKKIASVITPRYDIGRRTWWNRCTVSTMWSRWCQASSRAARRLGILVDHLVAAARGRRLRSRLPAPMYWSPPLRGCVGRWPRMGLQQWPDVPRGQPWKEGMCVALGTDVRGFWPMLRVGDTYADLRPELVGAVEQLIDFVGSPSVD